MAKNKLTADDVNHVARLAKLTLSKEEATKFQSQLSGIVSYIDELSEIPTNNVDPTSQTTGLLNVTRPDEIKPERILTQSGALSGSDQTHNNYFKVRYVFEGKK